MLFFTADKNLQTYCVSQTILKKFVQYLAKILIKVFTRNQQYINNHLCVLIKLFINQLSDEERDMFLV